MGDSEGGKDTIIFEILRTSSITCYDFNMPVVCTSVHFSLYLIHGFYRVQLGQISINYLITNMKLNRDAPRKS